MTVVGAAGGIGQPMSLLMKLGGKIDHLSLFDIVNTPGVAADISHCNSKGKVRPTQLTAAYDGVHIVLLVLASATNGPWRTNCNRARAGRRPYRGMVESGMGEVS